MAEIVVKPYDITNGEKVTYGYYSALEAVFHQFTDKLESFMYDEFKLVFDFEFAIKTGNKFQQVLDGIHQPSSIFILGISPLMRDSLLKVDNRYINLILAKSSLFREGKVVVNDRYSLADTNSKEVKEHMEQMLTLFQGSWSKIQEVECSLKRLVSNKIKAKIMDSTESCVEVIVTMKQNKFAANLEFCFSTYQLDRIIEKRGSRGLLATGEEQPYDSGIKEYLTNLLLNESSFELKGVLGTIDLSSKDLVESFEQKKVIPVKNSVGSHAVVELDNTPILAADIGETSGSISLQVKDSYSSMETESQKTKKRFSQISFSNK